MVFGEICVAIPSAVDDPHHLRNPGSNIGSFSEIKTQGDFKIISILPKEQTP